MSETIRRRRRPALSCVFCRQRKLKCDRQTPCSACVKAREECIFERFPRDHLSNNFIGSRLSNSPGHATVDFARPAIPQRISRVLKPAENAAYPSPASNNEDVTRNTIGHLETCLGTPAQPQPQPQPEFHTTISSMSGEFHTIRDAKGRGKSSKSVWHKTRLFGQSHWINGFMGVQDIFEVLEPYFKGGKQELFAKIHKTKNLARQIKAGYTPEWPTSMTSSLPPKDVSDALVRCYLETYESVYRVLHIPTFLSEYDTIWTSNAPPSESFMVLVKLVLGIGGATYDNDFSLRPSAVRWLYEAQTWLSRPTLKSRLNLQYLQISILHLFVREVTGVSEDFIWTTVGTLHRTAVYMGLHRDPTKLPRTTLFLAEMRRRVWNTILEMLLRSSFISGGPPLISTDDFDTAAPGNYNDEQLTDDNPSAEPIEFLSDTTVAVALRRTFPLRLKMNKLLNDLGSFGTYDETLRLDSEYKEAYRNLRQIFQHLTRGSPTEFQLQTLDLILSRHLQALHLPFSSAAVQEKAFAYSRTTVNETALKIWSVTTSNSSQVPPSQDHQDGDTKARRSTLSHLAITTSGFFRISAMQSNLLLALDVRARLKEEESLGPVPLRREMAVMLEEAKAWNVRTIEAGEPSAKGYILVSIVAAHIDGLTRGLKGEDMALLLLRSAEEAMDTCIALLERSVAAQGGQAEMPEMPTDLEAGAGLFEGWDFLTADSGFDFGSMEPMDGSFGGWPR